MDETEDSFNTKYQEAQLEDLLQTIAERKARAHMYANISSLFAHVIYTLNKFTPVFDSAAKYAHDDLQKQISARS